MKNMMKYLVVTLFLYAGVVLANQDEQISSVVQTNTPQSLNIKHSKYAYTAADLDGAGHQDYIVAAYSDGDAAMVKVFKNEGTGLLYISSTPDSYNMSGIFPKISAIDVDSDGKDEVVVGFSTGTSLGYTTWVLKWKNNTLSSIGPVNIDDGNDISSIIDNPRFIDFAGNQKLSIVAPDLDSTLDLNNLPTSYNVYTLLNGQYAKSSTLALFNTYYRGDGDPIEVKNTFNIENVNNKYVMTIVNGNDKGYQVSSATIKLNNVVVVDSSYFNKKTNLIKIPVDAMISNTLSVILYGEPKSELSIGIGPE